jgi:hypothetical protein
MSEALLALPNLTISNGQIFKQVCSGGNDEFFGGKNVNFSPPLGLWRFAERQRA